MSLADPKSELDACGAILSGHFSLSSGKHSGNYVQVALVGREPQRLQRLLELRQDALNALKVETVLSAAIGGIAVGQQLALVLGARSIFAERQGTDMTLRRGFHLQPGERVLLVEDVVTTGGTLGEVEALALAAGAEIVGAFTLINRSGQKDWHQRPLISVVDLQFPVYEPESCPLCSAGLPMDRPGSRPLGPKGG
jgi:orotate phosphoribosyltransferase